MSSSIPKKRRPWNAVSEQVYSISSIDKKGFVNMNIATYVTPVTMHPKRYLIAVYRKTKTHENIFSTRSPFLLQGLSLSQLPLIKTLGKKSGLKINKEVFLKKKAVACVRYDSLSYLKESLFVISLIPESYSILGDHDLIIAIVDKVVMQNNTTALMTEDLQKAGSIG